MLKRRFRNYALAGIIVLLPLAVTVYILWWVFHFIDNLVGAFLVVFLGQRIPGLGVLMTLGIIIGFGALAANVAGRTFISFWDNLMTRIPVVSTIYKTVKAIVDALSGQNARAFQKIALIEYPRLGMYALAFVTNRAPKEVNGKAGVGRPMLSLFLPTTPNPTSGFLLMVPEDEVQILDMSVEDGIKLIISGGTLVPSEENGSESS